MNYKRYKPTKGWIAIELVKISGLALLVSYLFFESLPAAVLVLPLGVIIWKRDSASYIEKRRKTLVREFQEMIVVLSGSLNAGYSLEKAFYVTYQELIKEGTELIYITDELRRILYGIECNQRVEELLLDFGERSGARDIMDFATLVAQAKIYGGNLVMIIRQTASNISERTMVEEEIDTVIASKRLEGRIMLVMPFLIIVYMKLTNAGYMDIMYETTLGNVVMSASLLLIAFSGVLIEKIVNIEV